MLLLVLPALAGEAGPVPAGATNVAVLVCAWDDTCDADAAWVAGVQGEGAAPVVPLEILFERDNGGFAGGIDTRAALAAAVERARVAATKAKWGAVATAVADAKAALAQVHGDVNTETLFTIWFLDGAAARARSGDHGFEYSFREAAAIANGQALPLPPHDEAATRAWVDEQRKLVVGGTGTLVLSGPEGVSWSIDGTALGPGVTGLSLLPGNHRAVATLPHAVRSWQGEVPVLAGRTVSVAATFSPADSARWVQERIEEAFDTLQAPPEVTALLSEWARRNHLSALRMLRVESLAPPAAPPAPALGAADPDRPVAADGEQVDHGDGIPATYAEEVVARADATQDAAPAAPDRRLRVMWFDPALQRFSLDAGPAVARPDTDEPRFRVSLQLGYTGMMDHHHVAADVAGAWRVAGPIAIEARLGLVRADAPYNLYQGWVDQQLYHVSLAARWAPPWTLAPFVTAGPELYIPVAVGGRIGAGAQLRIEHAWVGAVELHGSWLDQGPAWGIGVGLGHLY